MIKSVKEVWLTFFPDETPYRRIVILVFVWMLSIVLNYTLKQLFDGINTPLYFFPFSKFSLKFLTSGIPYAIIFILLLYFTIKYSLYRNILNTYIIGSTLIVLGNMSLGNIDLAFIDPIARGTNQYYHDAIKIDSWQNWLSSFNANQDFLLWHTATHPPGAILIQKPLFTVSQNPLWISTVFLFLSSISIVLVYKIFIKLGKDKLFSNKMALLYAVIPSVNIYSLATLDAIIAMLINIVILGVITVIECKKWKIIFSWGALIATSMTLVSYLTFGSLFIWGTLGAFSLYLIYSHKNKKILILLCGSLVLFLSTVVFLNQISNYNYLESFFTASKRENPDGFMLFSEPINYFITRVEDLFEIAVFLSLGIVAFLTTIKYKLQNDLYYKFSFISIALLLLMFLSGAYRTGETARACLFIVVFVLIFLKDIRGSHLTSLISFAALQTISMQLLGYYYW